MATALDLVNGRVTQVTLPTGGGSTPTIVPTGTAYTVPADTQVLGALDLRVDGDLVLDGELVLL